MTNHVVPAALAKDVPVLLSVRSMPGEQQVSAGQIPPDQVAAALAGIRAACDAMVDQLRSLEAASFALEFNVGFAVRGGKLLSLMFEPEATAGLKVTLQWERPKNEPRELPK